MAKCIACGCGLSFFQGDQHRRCASCAEANRWPTGHSGGNELNSATLSSDATEKYLTQVTPKTGAATLAYLSALIIAICSVISFFVLLEDNNGIVGFAVLVGGLGGAVFFMIMAEISHNVASLVRLANSKEKQE